MIEKNNYEKEADRIEELTSSLIAGHEITLPLEMCWEPKEDITAYELALCLPYFNYNHGIMSYQIDETLPHFRHFKIINHNK